MGIFTPNKKSVQYTQEGDVIWSENYDLDDCTYDELTQLSAHYLNLSSDAFHDGDNQLASYFLAVSNRYQSTLQERLIFTSI